MNAIAFSRTCCHAKLVNQAVPHLGKRAIMHGNYAAKYSNTCPRWLVTPSIEPIIHEQFKTIFFCFPGLLFFSHSRISTRADIFVFFFHGELQNTRHFRPLYLHVSEQDVYNVVASILQFHIKEKLASEGEKTLLMTEIYIGTCRL